MFNNKFVILNNIPSGINPSLLWFYVPNDGRLHLGDRLFLNKISTTLNEGKKKELDSVSIGLTLVKRMDAVVGPALGLNFSRSITLSPVERIHYELKKCSLFEGEVFNIGLKKKNIVYSPEFASSRLRVLGLEGRFQEALHIFRGEGFEITYIGANEKNAGLFDGFVTGVSEVDAFIRESNSFGFLGLDNYWMHIAASYGMRRFILQRRKFLSQNLINHVGVLNQIMSNNSEVSYL